MDKIVALEDAIEKNSLVGIYSVFYTIAHGDPNFSTGKFRSVLKYVMSKNIDGFIQEFDGEEFESEEKWDKDYWALIASSLVDNFCEERINHLEVVGKKVYPIKVVEQSKVRDDVIQDRKNTTSGEANSNRIHVGTEKLTNPDKRMITDDQKQAVKSRHAKTRSENAKPSFLDLLSRRK